MARPNFDELLLRLVDAAYLRAFPAVRSASRFLAREMRRERTGPGSGRLHIDVYWAVYVHEGRRRPIYPKARRVLVYFKNPLQNDPRLRGGYPRRVSDVKRLRLSRDQWKELVESGQMIVTKKVTGPVPPKKFFGEKPGEGMAGFRQEADAIVRDWAHEQIGNVLGGQVTRRVSADL